MLMLTPRFQALTCLSCNISHDALKTTPLSLINLGDFSRLNHLEIALGLIQNVKMFPKMKILVLTVNV